MERESHQIIPWYAVAAEATLAAAVPLLGGQWVVNLKSSGSLVPSIGESNDQIQLPLTSKADKLDLAKAVCNV